MINFLKKVDEYWAILERIFIVIALSVMGIVVFVQVVLRYFFHAGIPWAEELARYLMVWAGFLGGSLATRERRHISIDIIPKILKEGSKPQIMLLRFNYLLTSGFCFFLFYIGYKFVSQSMTIGRVSQSMHIPLWLVQLVIPLSAFFMGLRFLALTFGKIETRSALDEMKELIEEVKEK